MYNILISQTLHRQSNVSYYMYIKEKYIFISRILSFIKILCIKIVISKYTSVALDTNYSFR